MTCTEALVELKLLTKRISSATSSIQAISYMSGGVLASAEKDPAKFLWNAQANIQSANALIKRRTLIKEALVLSNATTEVTIGSTKMLVATAIERKESISFERELLRELSVQYANAIQDVERLTAHVQREVDDQVKQMGSVSGELIAETRGKLLEQRKVTIHDPIGLLSVIDKLRESIDTFEAEVDVKLSISNATTVLSGL